MKKVHRFLVLFIFLSAGLAYYAYAFSLPKWFLFDHKDALNEWQEKIFKDRVLYEVRPRPGRKVGELAASSDQACSGLLYRMKFDAVKYPMISWFWKVTKFPDKVEAGETEGGWLEKDDYAARVYVIFPSWNFLNIRSIEYVWDEELPEETIMTSPYSKNIKLIVVESGRKNLNRWVMEERNIYLDYIRSFGHVRSLRVGAIALMTDADNTVSTAEAYYKSIKVGYEK